MDGELLYRETSDLILKSFYEAYNTLGYGHLEAVYKRALVVSLGEKGLHVDVERLFVVYFHGVNVGNYKADIVVDSKIIVEVKAAIKIGPPDTAQCYNYMKSARMHVGFVLNFGPEPQFERHYLEKP